MVFCAEICSFMFLYDFTSFFKVFINIHKYANTISYKSDYMKKDMFLGFNLTPMLVL